jgi:ribosomal protein S18 acetylase RimI-like enzyme
MMAGINILKIKLMDQIIIKKAGIEDASALQQIGKETFFETFAASNTDEDMQKYLEENFNLDKISAEINNPFSEFYIAYSEIGYLKLNSGDAQTEVSDDSSIEIERVYVKSAYHGKKVGQVLYDKALEIV